MSSISSVSLTNFDPFINEKYRILNRHKPEYTQLIVDGKQLMKELAAIVADYVVDGEMMDRDGWKEYFGVDIGPETAKVQKDLQFENFYRKFHGPNPEDEMNNVPAEEIRQVCESCLIPFVRPETVTYLDTGVSEDFCLTVLENLAENPKKGHPAKFRNTQRAFQQHGMKAAGPSSLVMMLKGVVARGKTWSDESQNPACRGQVQYLQDLNLKTGFGCKIRPDALSQVTAVVVDHAVTGKLNLGEEGEEGKLTYGRTHEEVRGNGNSYRMIAGAFRRADGGIAPDNLMVAHDMFEDYEDFIDMTTGVVVLWESEAGAAQAT